MQLHSFLIIARISPPEVFLGKDVLKICNKSTGEHPCHNVSYLTTLLKYRKENLQVLVLTSDEKMMENVRGSDQF